MRIASLNIGKPALIHFRGEEILTGIDKRATSEARAARRLGIDGDGQADLEVHGGVDKAVYAFPFEHYAFYRKLLRQAGYPPGQFGENLTTEGMFEQEVRIGDRYRVREALFEVSQPRSPCYKFAIRMGAAEALRICIDSAKTGFYLRVLDEGMIRQGDRIELEHAGRDAPTVEEVHRLYYLDRKNAEGLARAANCTGLAAGFRDEFKRRLGESNGLSEASGGVGEKHDEAC
jgi:MOSC domain-containing protein YiiM